MIEIKTAQLIHQHHRFIVAIKIFNLCLQGILMQVI